jgi:hypothetical protein
LLELGDKMDVRDADDQAGLDEAKLFIATGTVSATAKRERGSP